MILKTANDLMEIVKALACDAPLAEKRRDHALTGTTGKTTGIATSNLVYLFLITEQVRMAFAATNCVYSANSVANCFFQVDSGRYGQSFADCRHAPYFASDSTKVTSFSMSASGTRGE